MVLMMNLVYLQTFLAVADSGSFTQAAESLDVSKGLVSRHVQGLENSLEVRLFHRTTRSLSLTEEGKELYGKARQIQIIATEAERRVRDYGQRLSGELRVTAPLSLGRMLCREVIPAFRLQYPDIQLDLNFGAKTQDVVFGEFDIAFRAHDQLPDDAVAKNLGFIRNVLVCSPKVAESLVAADISDLHCYEFIANGQSNQWNSLQLVRGNEEYEVEVKGQIASNTYESILELALQGLGVASLPHYLVDTLIQHGELIRLFPEWSVQTHRLYILYAQRRAMPEKVSVFLDSVHNWLDNKGYLILED